MTEQQAQFNGWARVEVMGHQTHIGYVRTEAYGQAVLFRIDTPEFPEREYVLTEPGYVDGKWTLAGAKVKRAAKPGCSVLIGAGSIYRIVPCSEAAALKALESSQRAELKLVELPPQMALAAGVEDPGDDEDDPDEQDDYEEPDIGGVL
jgi:hypothetical protein